MDIIADLAARGVNTDEGEARRGRVGGAGQNFAGCVMATAKTIPTALLEQLRRDRQKIAAELAALMERGTGRDPTATPGNARRTSRISLRSRPLAQGGIQHLEGLKCANLAS